MKISVITVCLNAEETIEETILSIESQAYKNVEHIIIDGASTDNTVAIINKHKDDLAHFISEPDKGLYDAMNKALKLASGDFIIFLNANDTFYDENVLNTVVETLEKNSDVKILYGDILNLCKKRKISKIQNYNNISDIFFFVNENICHQCIFYHKSLFEKYGYYSQDYKIYSDWDFNLKCIVEKKVCIKYLPLVISKFQLGGISSSGNNLEILKNEKKLLTNKYFKKYIIFIYLNNFFKKNYNALYQAITYNSFIKKLINKLSNNKGFELNIC